jgi:hypothetical protein
MVKSLQSLNDDPEFLKDFDPEKSSLTQIDPVDTLLREYAVTIMGAVDQVAQGKMAQAQLGEKLQKEAKRLQGLFYSQSPDYNATRWNRPEQLGQYIVNLGFGGEANDAVERLLRSFAFELVPNVTSFHQGKHTEEVLQMVAEELIERYRHFLLGIPLPADYWDAD